MYQPCLFCDGDASEPDHAARCDGRQGCIEARDPDPADLTPAWEDVRTTDPETSHIAAWTLANRAEKQVAVARLLRDYGPMTDEELCDRHEARFGSVHDAGPRKRRNDLVKLGVVRDSGLRRVGRSGKAGIVWMLVVDLVDVA